jgi:hypothetical protein
MIVLKKKGSKAPSSYFSLELSAFAAAPETNEEWPLPDEELWELCDLPTT